jgi:hypothetical protein
MEHQSHMTRRKPSSPPGFTLRVLLIGMVAVGVVCTLCLPMLRRWQEDRENYWLAIAAPVCGVSLAFWCLGIEIINTRNNSKGQSPSDRQQRGGHLRRI